ncbi:hypothetical protein HBI25_180440 [Parastagonospora nodorum]|nr:hypothetical protein HBH51_169810 [Parastagonospora nodorum]KAH4085374.1 hypothetical protein HBH46_209230 [Parastagonospora nodorum]KAH4185388.1 hypothetical protein HBH42_180300 [Parastagonospora nodorum]KAH4212025.1 hypothetical protein HBI95_048270 [Parastagonospora nodorum]KAH4266369.1 hypothetical protein HBI03_073530 [Parastagonospora nodorum]
MSARFSNRRLHPDAPGGEAGAKGNAEMVRTCSKLHILFYLFFCIVYQDSVCVWRSFLRRRTEALRCRSHVLWEAETELRGTGTPTLSAFSWCGSADCRKDDRERLAWCAVAAVFDHVCCRMMFVSWKLRCRRSVHSGRWPSIENWTQIAGEHEDTLYGLGGVVALCCISCCKVYALAHVDIHSKRPAQTCPDLSHPVFTRHH